MSLRDFIVKNENILQLCAIHCEFYVEFFFFSKIVKKIFFKTIDKSRFTLYNISVSVYFLLIRSVL